MYLKDRFRKHFHKWQEKERKRIVEAGGSKYKIPELAEPELAEWDKFFDSISQQVFDDPNIFTFDFSEKHARENSEGLREIAGLDLYFEEIRKFEAELKMNKEIFEVSQSSDVDEELIKIIYRNRLRIDALEKRFSNLKFFVRLNNIFKTKEGHYSICFACFFQDHWKKGAFIIILLSILSIYWMFKE